MNWQRLLPTLASIVIILVITLLRDRSRTLAAVIAVMPVNIPLALWVVSASADYDPTRLADFSRGLLLGLVPVILWVVTAMVTFRAGWSLGATFGLAYLVWAILMGIGFALGWLSFQ